MGFTGDRGHTSACGPAGRATAMAPLGTQFNAFLHATLGEEKDGMQLSVLSALARFDIDPWQRAAHLSHLPKAAAVREFAAFIEMLPGRLRGAATSFATAEDLIELLPSESDPGGGFSAAGMALKGGKPIVHVYRLQILLGYLFFVLLTQWFLAGVDTSVHPEKAEASGTAGPAAMASPAAQSAVPPASR